MAPIPIYMYLCGRLLPRPVKMSSLNHVTLDVIKFYKAYGYEPVRMDGNPADFAGEQVRFLEYLAACVLNGSMDQSSGAKVHGF